MDKTPPKPPPSAQKRNRQDDANMTLNVEIVKEDGGFVAKKPRDSDSEAIDAIAEAQDVIDAAVEDDTIQSNDFDDDYDDEEDDDYDDLATQSDMEDFLDDYEDDQSTASVSTSISTCSSVGSNTPSLVGENLEAFSLGETEFKSGSGQQWIGGPVVRTTIHPLRRSLFSNVPPYINFVHHNEVPEMTLPAELRKQLRWKLSNITPAVVKRVVTNSGFRLMRKNCSEWCGTWGKHMKSHLFKDIHEAQKINHLPGTFNIGRKDRLWKNYHRLRLKFGKEEFSFLPRTFCLPADTKLLRRVWEKRGCRAKWIVKPPALARGTGITVINKWSQIPKERPLIVQKYIAKPHLINDTKYDLRIYVLVTSVSPLTIYLYDEGLVRFASKSYSTASSSLSDVFTHLTNYSINKNSSTYLHNDDSEMRQGHKWTLSSLWAYLAEQGIDSKPVLDNIKDLVIKTIISSEHAVYPVYRANLNSHYVGFELFGFDILLDSTLKPWLIEVNISPSLHSSSPLDLDVKSPLTTEVFNIARYHVPPSKIPAKVQREILEKLNMSESGLCLDRRLYTRDLSKAERAKQDKFTDMSRAEYLDPILETLTPDDVRFLIRLEDELSQASHFSRIFPTQDTHKYFKYFDGPRYYNRLLDAWETKYAECRGAAIDRLEQLCQEKIHLKVPATALNLKSKKKTQLVDVSVLKGPSTGDGPEVMPTEALQEGNDAASVKSESASPKMMVKASKIAVTAKPYNVKSSQLTSRRSLTSLSDARGSTSSPDEMSVGGDASERSRTPSPLNGNVNLIENLDNREFCSSVFDGSTTTTSDVVDNSVGALNADNGN